MTAFIYFCWFFLLNKLCCGYFVEFYVIKVAHSLQRWKQSKTKKLLVPRQHNSKWILQIQMLNSPIQSKWNQTFEFTKVVYVRCLKMVISAPFSNFCDKNSLVNKWCREFWLRYTYWSAVYYNNHHQEDTRKNRQ